MAFINAQFPVDISYGSSGGPEYSTSVETIKSGFESRNQNWVYSRYTYDVGYGVRTSSDLETLTSFFHEMRGQLNSFRYKDWADYSSSTQNATAKQYGVNSTYIRLITKPIASTILINGTDQGFTIDENTGIVTGAGLSEGDVWTGEFDVPVRFEQDSLPTSLEAFESGSASVNLVEVRL